MTIEETWKALTDIHYRIKEHKFRQIFSQNKDEVARYEEYGIAYLKLIRESIDLLGDLAYRSNEFSYLKPDMWWAHNICAGLMTFRDMLDGSFREYSPAHAHDQDNTNLANIQDAMLLLEKYVMYLHRFIETKQLNGIVHIDYECQELPHNGWYYYHATEYRKNNEGKWELVSPIEYVDKNYPQKQVEFWTEWEKRHRD